MGEASCPKATIVVPVYNSARSIQRCLDSLLAQSERSIQVVCVNDGSTDDSLNVLRQTRAGKRERRGGRRVGDGDPGRGPAQRLSLR